uniref:Integrase catalytic domain-containing protein n=1 Tax=Fagus sylvatica TaxID=28930 RepID=A0A2N9FZE8_FAGSY
MLSPAPLLSEIRSSHCQEADSSPKGPTATLRSAVPGFRSRHRRYRWKALEILDSMAQKTAAFDTGRTLTRRLKIQCAVTLLHAPLRARLLLCHVSRLQDATSALDTLLPHQHSATDNYSLWAQAKDVWDMLASRYAGSDGAREHHLIVTLYQLRQDPSECITAFHSRMRFLWDQLATSEPVIKSLSDAKLVSTHRERTRLHQFLMGVLDDFESVRSQLLNRSLLPTVNQVVNDLVREETRLKSHRSSQPHTTILVTPVSVDPTVTALPKGHDKRRSNKKNSYLICAFCKHRGHTIDQCNMRAHILQRSVTLTASESVQVPSSSASNPTLSMTPGISSEWFLDSACCNHMTDNPHLTSAHTLPVLPTITNDDGSAMTVSHVGSISTLNLSVSDVFCVPKLHLNLLSTGQIVGTARKVGRLFELTSLHFPSLSVSALVIVASVSIELWHSRLGHVSLPRIQTLVSRGLLSSVSSSPFDCMPCQLGKQPALPFNNSESITSATFDLIHSDVWGPSPVPTTQYSKTIKVFRSDNARKYRQTDFSTILKHYGTIFHTSCAGTSQQNGRAERKLRHILDTIRALTNAASTPVSFWGEAALTAVYTINRCPSPVVQNTTLYERLFGTAPNYSLLKVMMILRLILYQISSLRFLPLLLSQLIPFSTSLPLLILPLMCLLQPILPSTSLLSPLSAPAVNPVNTTASEPRRSHRQAMKEELDALLKTDGTVDRYKARLVAKGFTQEYGINYEETFALVARLSSVHTLILLPGFSQPPGFSHKVCHLRRALYGLKQAPRAWFAKFSFTISQHGFSASLYDSALIPC